MTTTLLDLPVDTLEAHPRNPRLDVGDVSELADSITEQGLLEPLIVAPAEPPNEHHVLIAGHRRLAAARKAGLATVPCIVRADLDTGARQLEAMLVENLQRADLSPIEEACGYEQLKIYGYDPKRIAKATGRSKQVVDKRLALMKLDETKRAKVHAHELSLADAEVFIEFAADPAATAKLEEALGTPNWKWRIQRLREQRDEAKAHEKQLKALRAAGVPVVEDPPHLWPRRPDDHLVPLADLPDTPRDTTAEQDAAAHAACPGHVAVVHEAAWNGAKVVEFACTQPARHDTPEGDDDADDDDRHAPAGSSPLDPAGAAAAHHTTDRGWEEERAAREQRAADLQTAAKVRDEWLTEFLTQVAPTDEHTAAVIRFTIRDYAENCDIESVAEALGVTFADDIDDQETVDEVERRIAAATTVPQATQMLLRVQQRTNPPYWPANTWVGLLVELGYEPSDIERRELGDAPAGGQS